MIRAFLFTLFALIIGFLAGIILSEIIGIAGYLVTGQPFGIRYLPLISAVLSGAAALAASLLLGGKRVLPPPAPGASNRSRSLAVALGGCAVVVVCVVLALAANAGYWVIVRGAGGLGRGPAEAAPADIEALPAGDPARGTQVFNENGCQACHSAAPGGGVGPSLSGLGSRAANSRPDYTAERYIYESIIAPEAHVPAGYPNSVMPGIYGQSLSQQELADLVAFLQDQ